MIWAILDHIKNDGFISWFPIIKLKHLCLYSRNEKYFPNDITTAANKARDPSVITSLGIEAPDLIHSFNQYNMVLVSCFSDICETAIWNFPDLIVII